MSCDYVVPPEPPPPQYDIGAGLIQGPFEGCKCPSHHQHSTRGPAGCPVCSPVIAN